jgi:acetyl-CoA synthetase
MRARAGVFADREEAGRRLGERLREVPLEDPVVLGLPRGGVPVAARVAEALGAPLDVIVVRKVGVPYRPELAMGAVGEEGSRVVDERVVRGARVSAEAFDAAEAVAVRDVAARARALRGDRPPLALTGRTVVVVDDGVATGSTARAACSTARSRGAGRVVFAAPVGPVGSADELRDAADDVVLLSTPEQFRSVGDWYRNFDQVSDAEVAALLAATVPTPGAQDRPTTPPSPGHARDVRIPAGDVELTGHLCPPTAGHGVVVFVHGSGSSARSPRNRYVALVLNRAGLGTLLFDLLSPEEEHDRANVFDIPLLAQRLRQATAWLRSPDSGIAPSTPLGYFGASTGAAAALLAAAEPDSDVSAVVSRGGRPDLAVSRLPEVRCPTLLIVGGDDEQVLTLNRRARSRLTCPSRLVVVGGATHLFEEKGALERVADLARDWFLTYLATDAGMRDGAVTDARATDPADVADPHPAAPYSWRAAAPAITGLPRGRGLNIAYEAVDRHLLQGRGDHVAVRSIGAGGEVTDLTYAALGERTARFAGVLHSLGVGPGERVFSLLGRGPDLFVAAFGTLRNASVFCPLFSAFGPEPVRERLRLGDARVLVTTPTLYRRRIAGLRDTLPTLRHVLLVGDGGAELAAEMTDTLDLASVMAQVEPLAEIPPTDPGSMALLHFTSGTTGKPKAAVHVHEAVLAHHVTAASALDLRPADVFWCTADPGWVTGTSYGLIAPLTHGVTAITDAGEFDARRWYRVLQDQHVNVWYTAPTALRMLMRARADLSGEFDLSALRHVASVGEALNPEVVVWGRQSLGRTIHDNWWQTETGAIMIANTPARPVRPGSMGMPLPGIEATVLERGEDGRAAVVDGRMREVRDSGAVGELALRPGWPSMFRGYLHDEERYRACFASGWYLSGDLARVDEDGYFWFVGRADDVIKSAGHLIGPFEVESALMEHPAVAEVGVIGKPDPVVGAVVKAFVSLRGGYTPDEELRDTLLAYGRRRLGSVAPREVEFDQHLPHTSSGKVMRRLLKARELGLPEGDLSTLEQR